MPRKKRPPIPQSARRGPAKPATLHAVKPGNAAKVEDRLANYLYYVPLAVATWLIVTHEMKVVHGHFAVRHWLMVVVVVILWLIGPSYLNAMRRMRNRRLS